MPKVLPNTFSLLYEIIIFLCQQSEIAGDMKNCAAVLCEAAASDSVADETCINQDCSKPPLRTKSVGSIENFWESYTVVCRMLFDYCMQVMWNAVFYDSVAEYSSSWRRRKLWSGSPVWRIPSSEDPGKIDKLPHEAVGLLHALVFFI